MKQGIEHTNSKGTFIGWQHMQGSFPTAAEVFCVTIISRICKKKRRNLVRSKSENLRPCWPVAQRQGFEFVLCVMTHIYQQRSLLACLKATVWPLFLPLQWNLWLPGRFGVEVDLRQMFIGFRKLGGRGGSWYHQPLLLLLLLAQTRLFFINKSDDVLSRLPWVEQRASLHTKGRKTRLPFFFFFSPRSNTMKYCRLELRGVTVAHVVQNNFDFCQKF